MFFYGCVNNNTTKVIIKCRDRDDHTPRHRSYNDYRISYRFVVQVFHFACQKCRISL